MAGHSHWAGIKHKKGKADKQRSKIFSKLSKEITVAAKLGDKDPAMNPRLRSAIQAARSANMPKDNIERAIDKSSAASGVNFENLRYEGFGPDKIAVIVEALTDNKNRTASNIRTIFQKSGGSLGTQGSASHNFSQLGIIKTKPQWIKSSLATKSKYQDKYSKSIKNNDEFWRKEGKRITWIKPYKKIKDVKYSTKDVKIKWFHDGTLNASANCIDRHLKDKKDKTAIIWVGDDPKDSQKISYKELHEKVSKAANGLKKLGIKKGDRVTIYLTMIPELAILMLACVRIGAVHSIIFRYFFMKLFVGNFLTIFGIIPNPDYCSFIFFVF